MEKHSKEVIQSVMDLLKTAKTSEEWNAKCDEIKEKFDGYPNFWYPEIIQSGFAEKIINKFYA